MTEFVFDREIFKKRFLSGNLFRNRSMSNVDGCDSLCPADTDGSGKGKIAEYTSEALLADTLHNVFGSEVTGANAQDIKENLKDKVFSQLRFDDDSSREVFSDLLDSIYFDDSNAKQSYSLSLLRYMPATPNSAFGTFVYDVLFDERTRDEINKLIMDETNPIDEMVERAYDKLDVLTDINNKKGFSPFVFDGFNELYELMNTDFRSALKTPNNSLNELGFLVTYYLFIYLSQMALRLDGDLNNECELEHQFPLFKGAKESVSDDRDCIVYGWRRIERKTRLMFVHLNVLLMLNCHKRDYKFFSYSELYELYANNDDKRADMDEALDYIIDQYTVQHKYDADTENKCVVFPEFDAASYENDCDRFIGKVRYLFDCAKLQIESQRSRRSVLKNVSDAYNQILKMRFVKAWGSSGSMMMISKEDFITMISICQRSSDKMIPERGIQINNLFSELQKRGLCMDGKTKQYFIDYLIEINLIDSKCDSEEAQYVREIR